MPNFEKVSIIFLKNQHILFYKAKKFQKVGISENPTLTQSKQTQIPTPKQQQRSQNETNVQTPKSSKLSFLSSIFVSYRRFCARD
jgi:hypothetical protein